MPTTSAEGLASAAAALRRSHSGTTALDLLDLLLGAEQAGEGLTFAADLLHPRTGLGQLVAEAFDHGMTPKEWYEWTGPEADPTLSSALQTIWRTYVLPRFTSRYGVRVA